VDRLFVAIGSESLLATNQRTAYVALTRGKEQAVIFTDDRKELLKAMGRPDEPLSATEMADGQQEKENLRVRLMKRLAFARGQSVSAGQQRDSMTSRGLDHAG
jgi:ATP-dependent exoDNAse (exonuclease V) alpha subunit